MNLNVTKQLKGNCQLKNKFLSWLFIGLAAAIVAFADSFWASSICSGVLLPLGGIFFGPSAIIGFAAGTAISLFISDGYFAYIWILSALILSLVPWLLRKYLGDKNRPIIILKYYVVILASVIPAVAVLIVYDLLTGNDLIEYYQMAVGPIMLCSGYAIGFPLYYLIRCIIEKDFKNGRMGVHVFCIWMPIQFGVCIWFALKAYAVSTVSEVYENWFIINLVLSILYISVALCVWLFCNHKRTMLFIFAVIIVLSAVYNIVSFDTGSGTYVLIFTAVWLCFHAIFFKFYEKNITRSKIFKIVVSSAQIILMYMFVFIVALNAATFAIPVANGNEAGMIILGAPVRDNKASDILLDRIDTAAEFLNEHTDIPVIATGGTKVEGKKTEAQVITEELENRGISADRIYQETDAKTTQENFINCGKLLIQNGGSLDDEYIITTSMFHLLRAGIYARNAGFTHIRYLGASSYAVKSLTWYIRETFSILPLMFS